MSIYIPAASDGGTNDAVDPLTAQGNYPKDFTVGWAAAGWFASGASCSCCPT